MISFINAYSKLLGFLNATSSTDLLFWSDQELLAFMGDAAMRLSRAGLFAERNTAAVTLANSGSYSLPDGALGTVHVSVAGVSLRIACVRDLDALSSTWVTDKATAANRYALDLLGLTTVRLYPVPTTGGAAIAVLYQSTVGNGAGFGTSHRAPAVLEDFLLFSALGDARAKRSDGAMPDVAALARQQAELIASVAAEYWGTTNV